MRFSRFCNEDLRQWLSSVKSSTSDDSSCIILPTMLERGNSQKVSTSTTYTQAHVV